ncbi:phosphatidylserine decarboxylase [Coraliomargarita parva]|uniref:phosphatidylserine decarboxylase n=1 Tax=Coraliomargarita parva TaxID=3014050 RepID=UPI0022B43038|nr:phosphatidylserine decarboxylase [Coraliomargarita parva]
MNTMVSPNAPIEFYNRYSGEREIESIYGEGFLRWAYGNPLGRLTVSLAVKRLWFSRWYGWRMDRPSSQSKVAPFISEYGLDSEEFAEPVERFKTFNEFFYRKLKGHARPVDPDPQGAVFPADGRHLAIADIDRAETFYIKGQRFDLQAFVGDSALAQKYAGGSMLISRLCPVDYHRFHFPVAGLAGEARELPGSLRSVSPLALRRRLSILWENRRVLTEVESEAFGPVLVLEIGATCVGGIHQTYAPGMVTKGMEKGYFSFGGSCVTTIFPKGAIRFDADLLEFGAQGLEVYARMGERCGILGD